LRFKVKDGSTALGDDAQAVVAPAALALRMARPASRPCLPQSLAKDSRRSLSTSIALAQEVEKPGHD